MTSPISQSPSVDEVVENQLFIGNLASAKDLALTERLGITHVLSVCQDFPSRGPQHFCIGIADSEYEDILIQLPKACSFIEESLENGGRVLVHCVMGVSRSATVLAAYLMKSRCITSTAALNMIRKARPSIMPNYGFLKQLDVFAECNHNPNPANALYVCWKRMQEQHITRFLNQMVDATPIIPERLLLSRRVSSSSRVSLSWIQILTYIPTSSFAISEFPDDIKQATSFVQELGITDIVSISPSELPRIPASVQIHDVKASHGKESLLIQLPDACHFIENAIKRKGLVLVHSSVECRAAIVVCSYLMHSRKINVSQACSILEDALPLFNRTSNFTRHLELFEACGYAPTTGHPAVQEWTGKHSSLTTLQVASILSELNQHENKAVASSVFGTTLQDLKFTHDASKTIKIQG